MVRHEHLLKDGSPTSNPNAGIAVGIAAGGNIRLQLGPVRCQLHFTIIKHPRTY